MYYFVEVLYPYGYNGMDFNLPYLSRILGGDLKNSYIKGKRISDTYLFDAQETQEAFYDIAKDLVKEIKKYSFNVDMG